MTANLSLRELEAVEVPCVLCGSTKQRFLHSNCSLHIVECQECKFVFVNPQPTEQALRQYHSPSELLTQDGWSSYFEHSTEQVAELWTERVGDLARWKQGPDVKLLDIGAGYGDFLHYASKRGWRVSGFEFSPAAALVSQQKYGIPLAVGDLSDMTFHAGSFDLITMWHVLEHLCDPLSALQRCRGLLAPAGVLAIEVPNLHFIVRKSYRYPLDATLHLSHFSPNTLKAVLRKSGFKVLECRPGNTGFQYSNKAKIYAKKCLYLLSRGVEKLSGANIGDSIRLYATPDGLAH